MHLTLDNADALIKIRGGRDKLRYVVASADPPLPLPFRRTSPAGADPGRVAQFVVPPPEPYASSSAYFPTASNNDMVSRYKITFGAAAGAN